MLSGWLLFSRQWLNRVGGISPGIFPGIYVVRRVLHRLRDLLL